MVFMVSSVQVDVTGVDEQEWKQDEEDLNGVFASVYKVSIKQIGPLQGRHAILKGKQRQNKGLFCDLNINKGSLTAQAGKTDPVSLIGL